MEEDKIYKKFFNKVGFNLFHLTYSLFPLPGQHYSKKKKFTKVMKGNNQFVYSKDVKSRKQINKTKHETTNSQGIQGKEQR